MTLGWKRACWILAVAVSITGCRGLDLWSGVEFVGPSLRLVAEQPICGCIMLVNKTDQPLYLRSDFNGSVRGAAVLNAHETRRFRFDWAGSRPDDVYWIHASDPMGRDVDMRLAVQMEAGPSDCDADSCIYDTLLLNKAEDGR